MELKYSEDGSRFYLPADCGVTNAAELKDALAGQLKKKPAALVDVSQLRNVDLSFLQLFYSFLKRRAGAKGKAGSRAGWSGTIHSNVESAFRISGYMEHLIPYRVDGEKTDD